MPAFAEQRIAHGVFAIQRSNRLARAFLEHVLYRNPFPGSGPHIGDINILCAVIVIVEPAHAHPSANIFNPFLRRHVSKRSVAIVAVKVLAAEIVHYVKIGPAIAVVVAPAATKAVASIVLIQSGFLRHVAECAVALVAHQEVRRTILSGIIGQWIFVLIRATVINVEAEINVQPTVAIIVGDGGSCERSLRRVRELESIRLLPEPAVSFVHEKQGATRAHDNQVLTAIVVEIGKQRARGLVEDTDSGRFRNIFERAVSAIAIKAVGQPSGLANVEIVESATVNIGYGHAIVAVDINATRAVEYRAPIVRAMNNLLAIRRISIQRWFGNIRINRSL